MVRVVLLELGFGSVAQYEDAFEGQAQPSTGEDGIAICEWVSS